MSSWVMTISGLLCWTRAEASSPVEDLPTISTSSREERMASRPSLNMVWSSARCTRRAAILEVLPLEQGPSQKAHKEITQGSWLPLVNHTRNPFVADASKRRERGCPKGVVAAKELPRERRVCELRRILFRRSSWHKGK